MSEAATDFDHMTAVQLRECCEQRGLATTGFKKALINRLKDHDGTSYHYVMPKEANDIINAYSSRA